MVRNIEEDSDQLSAIQDIIDQQWIAALEELDVDHLALSSPDIPSRPWPTSTFFVQALGHGSQGIVALCISLSEVQACQTIDLLSSKLIAVKILHLARPIIARGNEIAITRYITELAVRHGQIPVVPFLLNYQDMERPRWFSISALPICVQPDELRECRAALPEGFFWLLYLRLQQALDLLHDSCEPDFVEYGDVQSGNIVVGYRDLRCEGLPEVWLIDFGGSTVHVGDLDSKEGMAATKEDRNRAKLRDWKEFADLLDEWICTLCPMIGCTSLESTVQRQQSDKKVSRELLEFHGVVDRVKDVLDLDNANAAELRADFQSYVAHAEHVVSSMSGKVVAQIRDVIVDLTEWQQKDLRASLQSIIESAR